ncbi:twin-arginine translocation signal domain-containing protein [Aestuariirhabdus litorea]|uniref:Twin-arginine translocation signal domain-containing protein n=1 Tax=Aestuariirhabdus litorea TaxID=2528527 RepID=A0A3P3VMG6_9GAMM|nr:twin-arginine translocation signal domain-containing protein [Aestuariirhabdus litorea]RRJ83961.1 twin-arginine translocation signal domain-containing protein [Aestuariirhabdus litorea]RWW97181.1 twin-arginine translocation signal domain-containing protein [Endozoicomonadaceae bacterium GTF-13]
MSKKPLSQEQLQRREFLKGVAVAGSAAAVVGASGTAAAAEQPLEKQQSGRYRKSDHVKAYYDTARI